MANAYKKLFWKLQTALAKYYDRVFRLTQLQVYSSKLGRSTVKYLLAEKTSQGYKDVLKTWQYPDVVKYLGELYMSLEKEKKGQGV